MNRIHPSRCAAVAVAALAAGSALASGPPPTCPDLQQVPPEQCPETQKFSAMTPLDFVTAAQPDDCTIERPGKIGPWLRHCEPRINPPPQQQLDCSEGLGTATCEAYPQGAEIRYTWSFSGGVSGTPIANTTQSMFTVNCLPPNYVGRIYVTLIGPNNLSSSTSMLVSCPPQ